MIFLTVVAIAGFTSVIAVPIQQPSHVGEIAQLESNRFQNGNNGEQEKQEIDPLILKQIKNTVNYELNAIAHGNISAAYDFMSKSFKAKTDLKGFTNFVLTYREYWSRVSFKWDKMIFYSDGVVKLVGTMPVQQDKYQVVYYLHSEGSGWKILGMQILPPAPF